MPVRAMTVATVSVAAVTPVTAMRAVTVRSAAVTTETADCHRAKSDDAQDQADRIEIHRSAHELSARRPYRGETPPH